MNMNMNMDMNMHVTLNELHGDEAGLLESIGNLCCKMIEVTNFQLCPGMLRADQIHLRNVHFHHGSNDTNVLPPVLVDHNNDNNASASQVMETECLFIMNVNQVHYYASLHSLKRSSAGNKNRSNAGHPRSNIYISADDQNNAHQTPNAVVGESTYVCLVRRTNAPLFPQNEDDRRTNGASSDPKSSEEILSEDGTMNVSASTGDEDLLSESTPKQVGGSAKKNYALSPSKVVDYDHDAFPEVHSQPFFVCMTLNDELVNTYLLNKHNRQSMERIITDGPFQCCLDFSQLNKLERPGEDSSKVQLIFRTGEAIEIETMSSEMLINASHYNSGEVSEVSFRRASMAVTRTSSVGGDGMSGPGDLAATERKLLLRKDRLMWCVLHLHAMLVDEEDTLGMSNMAHKLTSKYVDKVELQYKAAVHGFLADHASLFALIERQRMRDVMGDKGDTSLTMSHIFSSEKEEKEAEEVLNSTASNDLNAEELVELLKGRMRDLESDACRRLIAWEDEKNRTRATSNKATLDNDSMSLVDLYNSLENLDAELVEIHTWLSERALLIKPLTDECFDIERENEALHQQWYAAWFVFSYNFNFAALHHLLSTQFYIKLQTLSIYFN